MQEEEDIRGSTKGSAPGRFDAVAVTEVAHLVLAFLAQIDAEKDMLWRSPRLRSFPASASTAPSCAHHRRRA